MRNEQKRAGRVAHSLLCLTAGAYVVLYVAVALARIAHPYELNWFEGASLSLVRRILAGQPIYTAPSIDFIPHIYPPLYYYVGAAAAKIFGIGFFPLRLVSFASSLGCFALIFVIARREGGRVSTGLLAVGFFAACFRFSGAWYDIARVDSLSLLPLLAAIALVQSSTSVSTLFVAGLLGVLSVFTKQNSLVILGALSAYVFVAARGAARFVLPATIGIGVVLGTLAFDHASDGWFSYYVWKIPGKGTIPLQLRWILLFWVRDIPCVAMLFFASLAWIHEKLHRGQLGNLAFFAPLFFAAVLTSWSARIHAGGYDNVLISVDVWLAVGGALYLQRLDEGRTGEVKAAVLTALALVQLYLLAYDPAAQLAKPNDVETGDLVVEALRKIPGDVLVAHHPYLGELAGKPAHGHLDLVNTIPRGTKERARLDREIDDAIREQRFTAIVLDRRKDRYYRRLLRPDLPKSYDYRGSVLEGDGLWPVTGLGTRAQDLYLRRGSNAPTDGE